MAHTNLCRRCRSRGGTLRFRVDQCAAAPRVWLCKRLCGSLGEEVSEMIQTHALKNCGAVAGLFTALLVSASSAQAPEKLTIPHLGSASFRWQTNVADWQEPPSGSGQRPIRPR